MSWKRHFYNKVLWGQVLQYHFSSSPSIFLIKMRQHILFFLWFNFPFLRGLPLGRLSIIIPKASTIRLRNSSDPIVFPLKVTELLTWYKGSLSCFTCNLFYTVFIFNFSLKSDKLSSSQNSILRFSKDKELSLCHLINLILSLSISIFVIPFL